MRRVIIIATLVAAMIALAPGVTKAEEPFSFWPKGNPIYVVDMTAGTYPVASVVSMYDRYPATRLRLVSKCPSPDGRGCILVRAFAIPRPYFGHATVLHRLSAPTVTVASLVLVTSRALTARERQRLLCHEFGHALGLPHRFSSTTCMSQWSLSKAPRPDAQDYSVLDRAYYDPRTGYLRR